MDRKFLRVCVRLIVIFLALAVLFFILGIGLELYKYNRNRSVREESLQEFSVQLEAYVKENAEAFERLGEYETVNYVLDENTGLDYIQSEGELQKERNIVFKQFGEGRVTENETGRDVMFVSSSRDFYFCVIYCDDEADRERYNYGTKITDKLIYISIIDIQ
ncbi:MAG: hypothetical protein IJ035_09995 [Oscillospiraceae bacterium]|nr:hypothetical protein [Oscillospiraceae bacterium]